jgi:hypothetical protein
MKPFEYQRLETPRIWPVPMPGGSWAVEPI